MEQTASTHQVKHSAAIGTRYNKFASSSVRVFLAELPSEETDRLLADRTVLREGYLGLEDSAHEELVGVRDDGFAVNDGETTYEEYGVSAPVRDYRLVVGCITASAPRSRGAAPAGSVDPARSRARGRGAGVHTVGQCSEGNRSSAR